jgi:hypothetical protein
MRRKWWLFIVAPIGVAVFIAICGEVVMHLWNWLLPMLFGWRLITFWQALGLLVLCRLLFGGFHGHGSRRHGPRRALAQHWDSLTPEEREKLRDNLRGRCGGFGAPAGGLKDPA